MPETTACLQCAADAPDHPMRCGCVCHDHAQMLREANTRRIRAERGYPPVEGS